MKLTASVLRRFSWHPPLERLIVVTILVFSIRRYPTPTPYVKKVESSLLSRTIQGSGVLRARARYVV